MVTIFRKNFILGYTSIVFCFLSISLSGFAEEVSMLRLFGSPEQIGRSWGETNSELIVRAMNKYLRKAKEAGISKETLIKRSARYNRIVQEIAPHWHEEMKATSRTIGIDEKMFLAFCGGVTRNRFLHKNDDDAPPPKNAIVECTTYAVSRSHAKDGAIFFHKTRDNVNRPQSAFILESSLKNINTFFAVTNVSNLYGLSMVVNDKGLACSGNYPNSPTLKVAAAKKRYQGLSGGDILRHVAERASNCAEALAIVKDLVAKGYYADAGVGGNSFLFVDRKGCILEILNNSYNLVSKIHTKDVFFSRFDDCKPVQALRKAKKVDFQMFRDASREAPILTRQSISGMTVEIDPDHPELLTCIWIALPTRSLAFPVFMGQQRTPACLLDGSAYALGQRTARKGEKWKAQRVQWSKLETAMHTEKEELVKDVKKSIAAGNPLEGDIEMLEEWSRDQVAMITKALKDAVEGKK